MTYQSVLESNVVQGEDRIEFPQRLAGWSRSEADPLDWYPVFIGPSIDALTQYSNGSSELQVYANLYRSQSQGQELIGYANRIEGSGRWQVVSSGITMPSRFREALLADQFGNKRIVLFWYDVNGRRFVSDFKARTYYAISRLYGTSSSGLIAVSANCSAGCSAERQRLIAWLDETYDGRGGDLDLENLIQSAAARNARIDGVESQFPVRYVNRAETENPLVFIGLADNLASSVDVSIAPETFI